MSKTDAGRVIPSDERQTPLAVKYETASLWPAAKKVLGVKSTGAAIAVALYEARLIGSRNALVSYSRARSYYDARKNHPLLTFRKVVSSVDRLDAGGWIEHHRQVPGGRGWQSAMAASDGLMTVVRDLIGERALPLATPIEPIMLRDSYGKPMASPVTRETSGMARRIARINEGISSLSVMGDGVRLAAPLTRIFNTSLLRGGRFYGCGSSWQNVARDLRGRVQIDGEETTELDYATLHPAMLYAEAGAPLPADCYAVGHWHRSLVKIGLLVLINAETLGAARGAIAYSPQMAALAPGNEQEAMHAASRLIDDIKAVHRPIQSAFHSDAGARLMRRDSDLAERVQLLLLDRGVVALPVHDSFLVPASKRDELEAAMMRAAHEIGLADIRVTESRP